MATKPTAILAIKAVSVIGTAEGEIHHVQAARRESLLCDGTARRACLSMKKDCPEEFKMKVEELSSYGTAFDHMPLKALILQLRVMFSELRRKFGLLGTFSFIWKVLRKRKQLRKDYGETVKKRFADVPSSLIAELYMMSSMYLVVADAEGKEAAYGFLRGIFRRIGPTAHETLYNVRDLRKCEGDIFSNFRKLNQSIFEKSAEKGFYNLEEIRDSENLQYIRLTTCLNVDTFGTLGVPELGRLGCDIDKSGYAPDAMGNKVDLDFRRPRTLVNGDESCDFYYYRKGHAPADMQTF